MKKMNTTETNERKILQNKIKNALHSTPLPLKLMRVNSIQGCRVGVE